MIDPAKIAMAVAGGVSIVCATCRRYWEGADRGTKCTARVKCGSPLCGDTFSEYDGPMKDSLHLWCFVCGKESRFGIRAHGGSRTVGLCAEHIKYLERYRPIANRAVPVFEVVQSSGLDHGLGVPRKKTLAEVIAEAEAGST